MRTYTATIAQANFVAFRKQLIRNGGAIRMSAPVGGGFCVTYTADLGPLSRRMAA